MTNYKDKSYQRKIKKKKKKKTSKTKSIKTCSIGFLCKVDGALNRLSAKLF